MGFLCCNSSCHPLPAHTLALTRALPRHTPGAVGAPGRVLGERPQGGEPGLSCWRPAVPPSPAACQTSLDFASRSGASLVLTAEGRAGWWRLALELGRRSPSSVLALPRGSQNLEYNSKRKVGGFWGPVFGFSPCPGLQQLRSWNKDFVLTRSPFLTHTHTHTLHKPRALPSSRPAVLLGSLPSYDPRFVAGRLTPHPGVPSLLTVQPASNFIRPRSREAWPWSLQQEGVGERMGFCAFGKKGFRVSTGPAASA